MRLLDVFAAAAVGKSDDGGRKSFLKKASEQLDSILELASPFATSKSPERTKHEFSLEQKLELLSKLNASKDKSDEGIMKTMLEAAESIAEKAK